VGGRIEGVGVAPHSPHRAPASRVGGGWVAVDRVNVQGFGVGPHRRTRGEARACPPPSASRSLSLSITESPRKLRLSEEGQG
jgi:hypothetical protein